MIPDLFLVLGIHLLGGHPDATMVGAIVPFHQGMMGKPTIRGVLDHEVMIHAFFVLEIEYFRSNGFYVANHGK